MNKSVTTIGTTPVAHCTTNTVLILIVRDTLFACCYFAFHAFRFSFRFSSDTVGFDLCTKKNRTNGGLLVLFTYLCFTCFSLRFSSASIAWRASATLTSNFAMLQDLRSASANVGYFARAFANSAQALFIILLKS